MTEKGEGNVSGFFKGKGEGGDWNGVNSMENVSCKHLLLHVNFVSVFKMLPLDTSIETLNWHFSHNLSKFWPVNVFLEN